MENIERHYSDSIHNIHGDYADIDLVSSTQWAQYFEGHTSHERLYNGAAENLPDPFHEATLDYWKDQNTSRIYMTAVTNFSPDSINESERATWQANIIYQLREYMQSSEMETFQSPHEATAFYVRLSSEYAVRIQSMTSLHECTMILELEMLHEIENALNTQVPDRDEPTDSYLLFKNFASAWSDVIDIVAHTYGDTQNSNQPEHAHIVLRPNQATQLTRGQNKDQPLAMPQREIIDEHKIKFDDIAGYDDVKEKLQDLALRQKHPELSADILLKSTHGILLYGIPGTGKTTLLKAYATEIGAELVELSVSQIIKKWVGESARNLDQYFEELKLKTDKIVLLMDEFDALGVSDQHSSSGERTDTVNRLKEHITTISDNHPNIILVGATNNIRRVDEALIRPGRLLPVEVHAPNEQMRRDIWSLLLGKAAAQATILDMDKPHSVSLHVAADVDAVKLAEVSSGMVGAHFTEILNTIRRQRLRTYDQTGAMAPIAQADLLKEIKAIDLEP